MKRQLTEKIKSNSKIMQFIRFGVNGVFATAIHYGVYLLLQQYINVNIAYTIGYLVSFSVNFIMTSYFTFQSRPTWKKFIGFSGSHAVNYTIEICMLNLCIYIGIDKTLAPFPAMMTAVLVQFTILRFVYGKRK